MLMIFEKLKMSIKKISRLFQYVFVFKAVVDVSRIKTNLTLIHQQGFHRPQLKIRKKRQANRIYNVRRFSKIFLCTGISYFLSVAGQFVAWKYIAGNNCNKKGK